MHPADRLFRKKWGVFAHYLESIQNDPGKPHNRGAGRTSWNDCVDALDVERLARTLADVGAGWFFVTVVQGSPFMIAPNATFDAIAGTRPGEACAERDLVADLSDALRPRGIDLYLYFTGDGPYKHPGIGRRFGFAEPRSDGVTAEFVRNWAAVLEEYAVRYGDRVSGWWIDGCYRDWFKYTDELLEPYEAACKRGNPAALVAMNGGVFPDYRKNYAREDFVCGEFNDPTVVPKGRFVDGAQAFLLAPLGETWASPGSRYDGRYLRDFTARVNAAGGVATYDVALFRDGTVDAEQADALRGIGAKKRA